MTPMPLDGGERHPVTALCPNDISPLTGIDHGYIQCLVQAERLTLPQGIRQPLSSRRNLELTLMPDIAVTAGAVALTRFRGCV